MKILIVDDSKLILRHAQDMLIANAVGTEIYISSSGAEGLKIIQEKKIDIVILDIVMPGLSGIEVLKKIKESKDLESVKVIMFSSLDDKLTLEECFDIGATDFITKPLEKIEFLARIKTAIKEKLLEEEVLTNLNQLSSQNEELIELNMKLKNTQSQLIQHEKLAGIGHLAAGVAHEMNNPLGFINSNFETLKKYCSIYAVIFDLYKELQVRVNENHVTGIGKILEKISEYENQCDFEFVKEDIDLLFEDSFEGLERVNKIVTGLRTFSRVDKIEEFENYDLNEGIENTLVISRNEIKFTAKIALNLGDVPSIKAVGGQINQVILNMLLNSASAIREKFDEGLGQITISTYLKDSFVYFSIIDNGIGIREEDKESIFNPFFTTKPVGEGTGLGLSISYDIITNKHGGVIEIESEYGKGTEITVGLPLMPKKAINIENKP